MATTPEDLRRTRTTMVRGLRNLEDQVVWSKFFDSYWKLIYHAARTAGLGDADAQEVVQETVITVSKNIAGLHYDRKKGSFKGWLMTTTKWRIADRFRQIQGKANREESEDSAPKLDELPDTSVPDLDDYWESNWEQEVYQAALEKVKVEVKPLYFQMYERYVLREMPVKQVAEEMDVSPSQVYLAKHRVTKALKDAVRQLEEGYL